jgi:hypothetical protein
MELSLQECQKKIICFQPAVKNKFFYVLFIFETAEKPAGGKFIEIVPADGLEAKHVCRKMQDYNYVIVLKGEKTCSS